MFGKFLLPLPFDNEYLYKIPETKIKLGLRANLMLKNRKMVGYLIDVVDEVDVDFEIKEITKFIDKEPVFNGELLLLASQMSNMYLTSRAIILDLMIPSGKRETDNSSFGFKEDFTQIKNLSSEQEDALRIINEKKGTYYLYGQTGSGKSEVFLRSAEHVIKEGKQVIYLVPEISLTHQLLDSVVARFNNKVALLHSGLSPSQRLKYWKQIYNGDIDLIIGARSAVFAPCCNLGLIIVDEEHENSYKSGQSPRYHARQVAQLRCSNNNASLIMGSATPSLESYKMMKEGKIKKIIMSNRVAGGSYPKIEIVNMLREDKSISLYLEKQIRAKLAEKRGVILFLNRRGYSYYYHCESCGEVVTCPNCSVALTYHKNKGKMVCHYCGYSSNLQSSCKECGSSNLSIAGFGTEKVEEEVKKLFPSAKVKRLDTDSVNKNYEELTKTIDEFAKGEIDILLGTQMIAKGLNFPHLSLVGVILADSTLSIPDFRSEERTFSLLTQVAGRAGRFSSDGIVIVQTFRSENDAILAVKNQRNDEFYNKELNLRKVLNFPPYSRMIVLTLRSKDKDKCFTSLKSLENIILKISNNLNVELFGSGPCIIEKKASSYRFQIILKSNDFKILNRVTKRALELFKHPSSVYIEIDVDPLSLL